MSDDKPVDKLLNVLNSFRTKILTLRKMSEEGKKFDEKEANLLLNEGIFDLIEIKYLNEIEKIDFEKKIDECKQIQDNAGKDYLDQLKYEYHLDLIKNDIYTNKQLPKLPESNKVISDEDDNQAKIEIEAFNNILLGRKRLDKELKDIKEEKKKKETIFKNKLNYMKNINKYVEMIEKETNKTKKLFNDNKS